MATSFHRQVAVLSLLVVVATTSGVGDSGGRDRRPRGFDDGVAEVQFIDCRKSTETMTVEGLVGRHVAAIQIYHQFPVGGDSSVEWRF